MQLPEVREALRKFAEETTGWDVKDPHIKSITVRTSRHGGDLVRIAVSDMITDPTVANQTGERVLAIFESNAYLVVTPNRGGVRGEPYYFGRSKVVSVELEENLK